MKLINLIFILIFVFYSSACKKLCIKQQALHSMGTQMYNYVFRDTSVFIYIKINSNIKDTLKLYQEEQILSSLDTSDNCVDLEKQHFALHFYDVLYGNRTIYFIDNNGIIQDGNGSIQNMGVQIFDSKLSHVGDSSYYMKYIAFYPELTIQNANIYNIKKFRLNHLSNDYPDTTYLYWAPQCGIVRKEFVDSLSRTTTWELSLTKSKIIYL